ncbi:hypothetical protein [Deinococcus wulumuqiensis]|uniref:hypothetical protein n=1 Tax=Deinococcus wulumuqiensis TaxID=980427 RepID=UPI00242C9B42|nr:hypothetical protein [Deinococcus wulumuqiensis]
MTAAAKAAGLSWMGYRKWERDGPRRKFDYNAFLALCDYLGVQPEDITEPFEVPAETSLEAEA